MAVYKRAERKIKKPSKPKRDRFQEVWETRIREAEAVKDKWAKDFDVKKLKAYYEGYQKPYWWDDEEWFTVNMVESSLKVLKRSVVPRNLAVNVDLARTYKADPDAVKMFTQQGELRRGVLQYLVNQCKMVDEARMTYMDAQWAFGAMKIGYVAEMEPNKLMGQLAKDNEGRIIEDENGEALLEPEQKVVREEFFIDHVDYECILVDKMCGQDPDKTGRWIAHKIFKSVEDVKRDSLYKNTANLEASALTTGERHYINKDEHYITPLRLRNNSETFLPENELVVLYEIYDLERDEVFTIAKDHDKVLRNPEPLPPGIDKHPFVFLKFEERANEFYPIPAIYSWMGPQEEYNIRRNMMAAHIKASGAKYLYDDGKIDQDQLDLLQSGISNVFARASGNAAIEVVPQAPMANENYFDTTTLRKEFDDMTGIGQLQRGRIGAESATEAEIVERRSREGESSDHEEVMHFLGEAVKKLHKCVEANLSQEGAVSVTGPLGKQWVYFQPQDFEPIAGEYLFEVKADEVARDTLALERSQMLQFVETLGRNPLMAMSPVLVRRLADKFSSLANNDELIQEVTKLAQMQLQLQFGVGGGQGQGNSGSPQKTDVKGEHVQKRAAQIR